MCSAHSKTTTNQAIEEQDEALLLNAFWQFSLDLYVKPEVANYCLALQDQHNMQVNLLLYSIWLSAEGCILEPQLIKQNSQLQNWLSEIIPSIRLARKNVGENSKQDPLYKQLKACELKAEQKAQAILYAIKRTHISELTLIEQKNHGDVKALLEFNLSLCWQAFSQCHEKKPEPKLIKEFSQWMIIDSERKIEGKLNIK